MKSEKITIRKPVFITMAVLYIAIIVLGLAAPEWFSAGEAAIVEFTCRKFGALYDLLTLGLVAFCVWVMFSNKVGSIKIGGKDAKPIMSKWSWFVISLCEGALQLGAGIGILTGMTPGRMMWIILLVAVVITFLISSYTGIGKGVRFLSDKNAKLYMGLMLFVILFGPTSYILNNATQAFGFHIEHFFTQSTYLSGFDGEMWPTWWTINYWSWMIAYAPLMGIFLAKIARGRTLREFTIYNFLLPGLFGIVWFGIFGSSAIFYETNGGGIYQSMQELGTESAVFAFFKNMPISAVLDVVFLFTAFLSIVTLCDSMTTTISSLSINAKNAAVAEPPAKIKIFWGITVSLVCFVNLATASTVGNVSGIDATKQLAISTAFPLMFVMILILISGVLMLKNYHKYDTVDHPENSVVDKDLICDFDEDAIM